MTLRRLMLSLLRALAIVALAIIALWACGVPHYYFAPVTMMQPVVAPYDNQSRGGISVAALQAESPTGGISSTQSTNWSASAFYMQRIRNGRIELGPLVFAGSAQVFGIGPQMRLRILDSDYVWFGVDASIGFLYLQAGLPFGVQLYKSLWVYTDPTVMLAGQYPGVKVPIGLALATEYVIVGIEVGYSRLANSSMPCSSYDPSICALGFYYGGISIQARSHPPKVVDAPPEPPPEEQPTLPPPVYDTPPEYETPPPQDPNAPPPPGL